MWSDFVAILAALGTQDSFEIRNALRSDAAWLLGVIVAIVGGIGVALIYRTLPVVERYFERTVMVTAYLTIAAIIFWGVIDRFVFSNQQPWST
ncbi:MAG: TRAP transporter small permease, partial [Pseudomonadota bacterium]